MQQPPKKKGQGEEWRDVAVLAKFLESVQGIYVYGKYKVGQK